MSNGDLMELLKLAVRDKNNLNSRKDDINKSFMALLSCDIFTEMLSGSKGWTGVVLAIAGMAGCCIWQCMLNSFQKLSDEKAASIYELANKVGDRSIAKTLSSFLPSKVEGKLPTIFGVTLGLVELLSAIF